LTSDRPVRSFRLELARHFLLLDLLLAPIGEWPIRTASLLAAVALMLAPAWGRQPLPWLALAGIGGLRVLLDWPLADNHAYLLTYWCLGLGLAAVAADPARTAARCARILLMLTFCFAVMQKATSPSYLDGTFFTSLFVIDERFVDFGRLVTGMTAEDVARAKEYLDGGGGDPTLIPAALRRLGMWSTWWNLLDQALVTAAFALSRRSLLGRHRDLVLLAFCAITFAVAPVAPFGWLLLSMGVAQSAPGAKLQIAYVGLFLLLVSYDNVDLWALGIGAIRG
jgi:hypothetical protein